MKRIENAREWNNEKRVTYCKDMLNKLFRKYNTEMKDICVEVSNVSSLGLCYYDIDNGNYTTTMFEFSNQLFDCYALEEIKDTIKHEFAHHYTNTVNNKNCGHNSLWKSICLEIGCKPNRVSTASPIRKGNTKYTAMCEKCGFIYNFHRISKNNFKNYRELYLCGQCGEEKTLKVTKNY